jgi:hypothetical protein
LQLFGLTGAFLTGDLFNLFVFFEVMLLASYTLLAHGGGVARTRAGISYVVLNLVGSALFLIALGLLYGTLGTLNLADLAHRLTLPGHDQALARLACALLIAVFALKAGLLPLSFWLPHTYTAAGAPVAALFAIMTKVGIVAILRVQVIALAPSDARSARPLADDAGTGHRRLSRPSAHWCRGATARHSLPGWSCSRPAPCWSPRRRQMHRSMQPRSTTWCNRRWPALLFSCSPGSSPGSAAGPPISFTAGPPPQATWLKVAFLVLATTLPDCRLFPASSAS